MERDMTTLYFNYQMKEARKYDNYNDYRKNTFDSCEEFEDAIKTGRIDKKDYEYYDDESKIYWEISK